jgi:transposase
METRNPYPSDVSNEEWQFVAPYLTLMTLDAEQRRHDLREVFNALRWLVKSGAHWRMMPNDFPPWPIVCQQTQRWFKAGCIEAIAHDLRMLLRLGCEREPAPTAAILDSRTLQSTLESGARAGDDGAKRRKGSKVHLAVDTLGHLLALHVSPADEQDRTHVEKLAQAVQEVTGQTVEVAFVDQGYTGEQAQAQANGRRSPVACSLVRLPALFHVVEHLAWIRRVIGTGTTLCAALLLGQLDLDRIDVDFLPLPQVARHQ